MLARGVAVRGLATRPNSLLRANALRRVFQAEHRPGAPPDERHESRQE